MTKRITTFLLTLLLLIGMSTTMTYAQEGSVELKIGETTTTYTSFNEAIDAFNATSETDGTITLTEGMVYESNGYNLVGKNLTVNGNNATLNVVADETSPIYPIMTANGSTTYNQITINASSTNSRTQLFVIGHNTNSGDATVTLNGSTLTVNGGGLVQDGIAYQGKANTIFNVVDSTVLTTNNTRSGVFTETEATKQLNITESKFESINNPGSGIVSGTGKFTGNVTNSIVNVNNNRSYGTNGGVWVVTGSTMNVNDNGGHGFSVTTLAITNSTVHGDRNGYQGIHSTGQFTAVASVVSASENRAALGNSAGLYLGNATHSVDAATTLTLNGNLGPGLHVNAGESGSLTIAQGAKVEIIDNRAQSVKAYHSGGGVFVRSGTVVVPTDAAIYNNRAVVAGDDIFVNSGSITFGPATPAILNEAPDPVNHHINGWFMDEAEERWNVHDLERDEHAVEVAPGTYGAGAAYKAAHHNKVDKDVIKVWVDGPQEDRPTVTLNLMADPGESLMYNENDELVEVEPIELVHPNTAHTFENLKRFHGHDEIVYTVDEAVVPANYEKSIDGLTVTNTYVIPKIDITVNKVWVGGPEDKPVVELQLYRNNEAYLDPVKFDGITTYTFVGLDETDQNGVHYVYRVDEVETPTNYVKSIEGFTVTNTYVSPKIDVTVTKIWVGGPEAKPVIELQLYRNDEKYLDPVELPSGTTEYTFEGLDETDQRGVPFVYRVDEVETPEGYTKLADKLTVTNTFVEPKPDPKPTPKPDPKPDPKPKPELPDTGSKKSYIGLVGVVSIAGGAYYLLKKKED